ncbi:Ribosomal RNA-processing protein 8 [Porphyridium purpureum]|uniref:Ribosomal RNA-processing protein 8 n=1 Tax=Porphyridium purpureum TaxID=35688 RepID=A0A5J4Z9I4_PORPP|nr:Ribosomal RNA-processing protein 8 [Porphyridium purpureum]|eukprot:POR0994..scf295_1
MDRRRTQSLGGIQKTERGNGRRHETAHTENQESGKTSLQQPREMSKTQRKLARKLSGAHFRSLNEQMYGQSGAKSFADMQLEPELFGLYHEGYAEQVRSWPCNPLDRIVQMMSRMDKRLVVADFGCGTAELARQVPQAKVHSFDLVAHNERITACDMAHVPLDSASVDVAVFCLSLMGTNYAEFIREANRVLRNGAKLFVAEVASRFKDTTRQKTADSGARRSTDEIQEELVPDFVAGMRRAGFELQVSSKVQGFFLLFLFKKVGGCGQKNLAMPTLKLCTYKKR